MNQALSHENYCVVREYERERILLINVNTGIWGCVPATLQV